MTEKRLYHRMNIELPVSFEMSSGRDLVLSTTMDVSVKGLALKLTQAVSVGDNFRVSIAIDDKIIKVDARVVWVEKKGEHKYIAGFKIADKLDQDEIEFVRFIAQKMFEFFQPKKELKYQDIEVDESLD